MGGAINTYGFGSGATGDINVRASEINIDRFSPDSIRLVSGIGSFSFGVGNGGNITIAANTLRATEGGGVVSGTVQGQGGDVNVAVRDSIVLDGLVDPFQFLPANTTSLPDFFTVSQISAFTFGTGNAGNIEIATKRLQVVNGAAIFSSTFAEGNAGNINISATESITVSSILSRIENDPATLIRLERLNLPTSTRVGSISSVALRQTISVPDFDLPAAPIGNSGAVTIRTGNLSVLNDGSISVGNDGFANAGDLNISAKTIRLNNQGEITATTAAGRGGNIKVDTSLLVLSNRSNISATAGGTGNGGNITINSDVIALLQNSRISANASQGLGGSVNIAAKGIFLSRNSTITAMSDLGPQFNGVVQITTPDINLSRGAVPAVSVTEIPQIASVCNETIAGDSSFTITGRGGIGTNPEDFLSPPRWRDPQQQDDRSAIAPTVSSPKITEATGWEPMGDGRVRFTAPTASSNVSADISCARTSKSTTPKP